ncbi:alpha/beta hydrolase [Amycolatopsis jiangsuensis]|uniref:Acetyl esterase/lipase n=1 Tax=Amycolatopsis jiangsuensis TaxID=1181879 RepID=A0A840IJZ2_9PSEU|nr:alpha/beta hydrolase [Amycolatopsis jiangsuensis]MBB4682631.1 acetyl esterase/lipase [Amycolatopsis jiangsuensis]
MSPPTLTLEYARSGGQPLLLDLYLPAGSGPHPVTLWIHGGAWFLGDRADDAVLCAGLADRGIAVASIDYRLGEAGAFPASVDDVRAAVRWLRAHGPEHRLATGKVGSWGASAGGHLCLMAALTTADGNDRIDAVVDCYGPTDLVARLARTSMECAIVRTPPDVDYLRTDIEDPDLDRARHASPLHQRLDHAPPVLILHGDRDQQMALDQSRRLHEALVAAGRESHLLVLGGAGHGDPRYHSPWILDTTAAFLKQHLGDSEKKP